MIQPLMSLMKLQMYTQDFYQLSSLNEFDDLFNINDTTKWKSIETRTINIIGNKGPPIQYKDRV